MEEEDVIEDIVTHTRKHPLLLKVSFAGGATPSATSCSKVRRGGGMEGEEVGGTSVWGMRWCVSGSR